MNSDKSGALFQRAIQHAPGGVNSPVRAWKAVGGAPRFIAKGYGAHVEDEDGNRFIDYVGAFGPAILGHAEPNVVRAGSGALTLGVPDSPGVPADLARLTLVANYNDLGSVERCFEQHRGEIAAVIVEPVAANMGVVKPEADFLKQLGSLAHRHGALLICDEVITGFRLRFGAAYELYGAQPDLIMLGKIIGGGNPIGAVGGPAELMDLLAPAGAVYQAGTLSGNPLSVRAGIETLKRLAQGDVYQRLEAAGSYLEAGFASALSSNGVAGCVNRAGSLLTLFFGVREVRDAAAARQADTA